MPEEIVRIVELALAEDLAEAGDITSQAIFAAGAAGGARIITRQACTVSGMEAAAEVCRQVEAGLTWLPLVQDGQQVPAAAELARLDGSVLSILAAERTVLNFLARLSGIATLTRRYVELTEGLPVSIAATRKTSPGLRLLEKQAVEHGGGSTHRLGLYDAVLIKDNHILAAGSIAGAVAAVRRELGDELEIEVEADTLSQMKEAIEAGADRVLLDNMSPEEAGAAITEARGRVKIEVSGGIDLDNIRSFAEAGPDMISVGALTHSVPAIDMSLEMDGPVIDSGGSDER